MIPTQHSTVKLRPKGSHPNYVPYDAVAGRFADADPALACFAEYMRPEPYADFLRDPRTCATCGERFETDHARHLHVMREHKGRA